MRIMINNVFLFALILLFLTSCATLVEQEPRRGISSSLVDYLYPDGQVPPKHEETTPYLRLPLTVGLAFVPSQHDTYSALSEAKKTGSSTFSVE